MSRRRWRAPGTHFTCFTSTEVQILTPEELRARWAHLACHADLDTNSLILAVAPGSADAEASELSMHEVQGSEQDQGVRLAQGATVVLSACNTGRGDIKAEGVVCVCVCVGGWVWVWVCVRWLVGWLVGGWVGGWVCTESGSI
jgi:CHAT domain-containing protein